MPKTKQQKEDLISLLTDKLGEAKSVVMVSYTGLNVPSTEELRNKCKDEQVEFLAVKKTLLKKVLNELKFDDSELDYEGSLAVAFGREDEVAPAKILNDFSKDHNEIIFRGGIFESKVIGVEKVKMLAALPSKPELYAKIVGSLNAPISGFVNVMAGNLRGLVTVLNAIKDNKQ
ncbi:50S ribosomal protein L10 [Candidatus Falkowbacteria bacterium CG10_big_fil_rev_8_21_14_0_10_39_11]|uniref:Large ribosomal subunit protein uL10 n=1 Tax=Candidatus Falkowbacteria bacterium CG10_big_fil_rev_8_21_14_0_10_39_11 TaxID=1974565 RepID=A0A2H0V7Q5_9BACT|nr:MAG: 50S ribosomal protein L10 [Candidatus Falkowbacteria bacterium CG10_big_fil_rev_8_21_14_0_10_39_11]